MTVILNATDPFHLVYAGQGAGVVANRDTLDTVLLGPDEGSLFRSNPEVSILDPLSSVPITGEIDLWAIVDSSHAGTGDDLMAEVDFVKSGVGWAPSPASIAEALIGSDFATTLAIAMAQAIAQGGITLVSEPVALYTAVSNPAPTGAGFVGASVFSSTYADQNTRLGASNEFDGYVGQPWAVNTQKFYFTEGSWSGTRLTELQTMAPHLNHMVISVKPGRSNTGIYTNTSKVSMAPSGATLAQEHASLVSFLATLNGSGITPAKADIILWNEANDQGFSGAFTADGFYPAYVAFYQDAIRAAGYALVYNPLLANGHIANFYPGDANCDKVLVDYYAWDYFKGGNNPAHATLTSAYGDNPMALADNHLPSPIPFGVIETGVSDGQNGPSTSDWVNWWNTQIVAPMVARLQSGKVNGDGPIWFDGGTGLNQISTATPATQIAAMQSAFTQLDQSVVNPATGLIINATSTKTLTPNFPSPGAGYAVMNGMSYSVVIRTQSNATLSNNPFLVVKMRWFEQDDPNAVPVDVQFWIVPIGGNAGGQIGIHGHGPQIAQFLQVQIQNLDSNAATVSFGLTGEGRVASKHDWRWDVASSNAVANAGNLGFNLAGGAFNANSVGSLTNIPVAAGATHNNISGLFAGDVWVHWTADNTKLGLTLLPLPSSSWGANAQLWASSTNDDDAIVGFPRAPVQIVATNTDTVSHTFSLTMIAIED